MNDDVKILVDCFVDEVDQCCNDGVIDIVKLFDEVCEVLFKVNCFDKMEGI